jgi:hypothetical protein
MLPVFLLTCFFFIEDDSDMVIMRHKTYFRYFVRKWARLNVLVLLFMLVQISAILVTGIGLSGGNHWEVSEVLFVSDLFDTLAEYFATPLQCFAVSAVFMFAGMSVIMLITMWFGHFLSKQWTARIMMGLYILSVFSWRIEFFRELPLTMFNHLTIMHHSLINPTRLLLTVVTAAVVVVLVLWTARRHWNRQLVLPRKSAGGITPYYCKTLISKRNIIILCAITAAMLLWKWLRIGRSGEELDSIYWLILVFAGHEIGEFYLVGFIEMLILNCTPIYLFAAFMQKMTTEHSSFVTIRLKKRSQLMRGILTSGMLIILLYGVLLAVIPIAAMAVLGLHIDGAAVEILGISVGLKLLDLTAHFLLIAVIYCIFGSVTIGFVLLILLNLLCVMPLAFTNYLPFGMSSLLRLNIPQIEQGIAPVHAAAIMLVTSAVLLSWLCVRGYKHLPKN